MNEIKVLNKKHNPPEDDRTIYVGRPSILGNPFTIEGKQTRTSVLKNYERWLDWKIQNSDPTVCGELERIAELVMDNTDKPVNLVCWCSPLPCHGDVLKRVIDKAIAAAPNGDGNEQ